MRWKVMLLMLWSWALALGCHAAPEGDDAKMPSAVWLRCVAQACSQEHARCEQDLECAGYLTCIASCPAGQATGPEPSCESACAGRLSSSAARLVQRHFRGCSLEGSGAEECAAAEQCQAGLRPAVLCQRCPTPGPEALGSQAQCAYERCCDTMFAARKEPEYYTILDCRERCKQLHAQEPARSLCEYKECFLRYPVGYRALAPYVACLATRCHAISEAPRPTPCGECLYRRCANAMAACGADAACSLIDNCFAAMGCNLDPPCLERCVAAHEAGRALMNRQLACVEERCSAECG